ncbi:hypothetical protein [Mycolicibacterium sp. 120320]|uniref:hypothetical protein n=1 Tax=unclassified Mycolicibacterium TaxID=2636767 RepID=UPI003FA5FF98
MSFPLLALCELVEAAVLDGQPECASAAAEELSQDAAASGTAFARGKAAHARALISDGEETAASYLEAIELLSETRMAIHPARARLGYGRWLRGTDQKATARQQLRLAHADLAAMGAAAFAEQARR